MTYADAMKEAWCAFADADTREEGRRVFDAMSRAAWAMKESTETQELEVTQAIKLREEPRNPTEERSGPREERTKEFSKSNLGAKNVNSKLPKDAQLPKELPTKELPNTAKHDAGLPTTVAASRRDWNMSFIQLEDCGRRQSRIGGGVAATHGRSCGRRSCGVPTEIPNPRSKRRRPTT